MNGKRRCAFSIAACMAVGMAVSSASALAAKVRLSTNITSSGVKLSDLFSGLEAGQDCDIGPAPPPGRQIVVDQAQLAAIAAQFGVDWQPGVLPAEVTIARLARPVTREELLPLIRAALVDAGSPEDSDIGLSAFSTIVIPAEISDAPEIESLNYDRAGQRFTAQLLFGAQAADQVRVRIGGTVQEMIEIPVLAQNLASGSVIVASDLRLKRVRKSLTGDRTLMTTEDAAGLALRHRMTAGSPISLDELVHPLLVSRGMSVILRLMDTGLVLTVRGQAIDGGALDDHVHVINPTSRAVLIARVTGPGAVQIDPTSAPVLLASQQSGLPPASSMDAVPQFPGSHGPVQ